MVCAAGELGGPPVTAWVSKNGVHEYLFDGPHGMLTLCLVRNAIDVQGLGRPERPRGGGRAGSAQDREYYAGSDYANERSSEWGAGETHREHTPAGNIAGWREARGGRRAQDGMVMGGSRQESLHYGLPNQISFRSVFMSCDK